jgi:hypothetical protein
MEAQVSYTTKGYDLVGENYNGANTPNLMLIR